MILALIPSADVSDELWTTACRKHLATDHSLEEFERSGVLMVRSALDPDLLSALRSAAEALDTEFRNGPDSGPHHVLNRHDLFGLGAPFDMLVDMPTVLPTVWAVLGWNIACYHTQLVVTPPAPTGAGGGAYGWHQDNNRMNVDLGVPPPQPRISLKVGYLLSDLPDPGMGNLSVVPGSHERGRPSVALTEQPDGAVEICGRAGDAVVFDRRTWHAASTNNSEVTRVMVFVGYAYRWVQPKSAMNVHPGVDISSAVRRQLLGESTSANGRYDPTDHDVPLRAWIAEHVGAAAVAP